MIANRRGVIFLLIFGLLTAGLCGCDQKLPSWYPFANQVIDNHGITTPTERITKLREMAVKAPEVTDPGQRESICQGLAQELVHKEPDSIVRSEILKTLAAYGGPTATNVLKVAVRDPDVDVRISVCVLWGKRSDAEAAGVLEGMLTSDSDRDVRMAAARALGHVHDPAAIRALGTALDDTDPAMQHCAMVALRESSSQDIGTDPVNVDHWRQYVKNGQVPSMSLAQRLFPWYR